MLGPGQRQVPLELRPSRISVRSSIHPTCRNLVATKTSNDQRTYFPFFGRRPSGLLVRHAWRRPPAQEFRWIVRSGTFCGTSDTEPHGFKEGKTLCRNRGAVDDSGSYRVLRLCVLGLPDAHAREITRRGGQHSCSPCLADLCDGVAADSFRVSA